MDLELELARRLMRTHPVDSARVLERLDPAEVAKLLAACEPALAASVLARLAPAAAREALAALDVERAAERVAALSRDIAARLVRSLEPSRRAALESRLPDAVARSLKSLLRFPDRTAGALMDPDVLALPQDMRVRDGVESIRKAAAHAHYNVYVIDRDQRLVGVITLRELLLARGSDPLRVWMQTPVRSLSAFADRQRIVSDRGWREVHCLPVVDDAGTYLGAIRYRTLRAIEAELRQPRPPLNTTANALGDLFRAGAVGLVDALAGTSEGDDDA